MATTLTGSMTAQDVPSIVFTAYEDFYLRLKHTAGASAVQLLHDLLDDSDFQVIETLTTSNTWLIEIPPGGASKFRLMIGTLDTGPVVWAVRGKLNANDTIGGASPGAAILDENGDDLLDEDGSTQLLDEAA
jgi:hypothetical protein